MKSIIDVGVPGAAPAREGQRLWITIIVAGGVLLSGRFACATPFAALATLAALKLGGRATAVAMGAVLLANQIIGFTFLAYPLTWDALAWGLAICASSALSVLAARGLSTRRQAPLSISLPFVAAFAAYELGLYVAGRVLSSAEWAFSLSVISYVFVINLAALCGLLIVYHLAALAARLARLDAGIPLATETSSFR